MGAISVATLLHQNKIVQAQEQKQKSRTNSLTIKQNLS
jgi:hypothetical protein